MDIKADRFTDRQSDSGKDRQTKKEQDQRGNRTKTWLNQTK